MPLARLENFLKNLNGNTLYVDPNELDATDSIENRGNSRLRPFKTIQRALIEAARFAYAPGSNNDLFDQTTILISPGTHYIDNRPGYYIDSGNIVRDISNNQRSITEFNILSNFDITDSDNQLYIYNSVDGGVILPKGTSLVATDLRKTKIRPLFVPNPETNVERTSIFRLTGSCYFFGFSIYDGDPLGKVYNTYGSNRVSPSYSHHKLTAFEYADGVNSVIKNNLDTGHTDLQMYYYKLALGFGQQSGRNVLDGYLNFQPNVDEYRIVGELGAGEITIVSVISGDGSTASTVITVETETEHELSPLTPILIAGVGIDEGAPTINEYNGNYIVSQVISPTEFTYIIPSISNETSLNPSIGGASVKVISDTTTSSSPYVFNCSLKSVYGMNGLHADGSKATGFKSVVTAQFTGISLQKDDRAFVNYDPVSASYLEQDSFGVTKFLHQDSDSIYHPEWKSFHIKASNDAFIQCVSIFAIGYANQFVAESGGDQSITNSNSNFGQNALYSAGFKSHAFPKDDCGFITHIIPPKDVALEEQNINLYKISDVLPNSSTRIYLNGYDDILNPPKNKIRGYSIGGRLDDKIYFNIGEDEYYASITPNYEIDVNITSIDTFSDELTLSNISGISTGLSVKVIAKDSTLPDGIVHNQTYFVRPIFGNNVKLFENLTNCNANTSPVDIQNIAGLTSDNLNLVSKVSDRSSGNIGSPIQWDDVYKNWYISIENPSSGFLDEVGDSVVYLKRIFDFRSNDDRAYRIRYVIPKDFSNAAVPSTGFILQKSSSLLNDTYAQDQGVLLSSLTGNQFSAVRNKNIIIDAYYSSETATIITKSPHNLKVGNKVDIYNLKSSNEPNPSGIGTGTGFNGNFVVDNVIDDLTFTYSISRDPGTITAGTSGVSNWLSIPRDCNQSSGFEVPPYTIYSNNRSDLPFFTCNEVENHYQTYSVKQIQKYIENSTDGIYHLTLDSFKNIPISPFNTSEYKFGQSLDNLYPQKDYDNLSVDPEASVTSSSRNVIGSVNINDPYLSSTKETILEFLQDFDLGKSISQFNKSGNTVTILTSRNHGLGGIRRVDPLVSGSGYLTGDYYDIPLCGGTGQGATVNVKVNGSGSPYLFEISNPGSGYSVNDVLTIRGIPGSTSTTRVIIPTSQSLNFDPNDSDTIQILGASNSGNNGAFIISSVTANSITFTNPLGATENPSNAIFVMSGVGYGIQSSVYNPSTQITTVTTESTSPHSFAVGNKILFNSGTLGICTVTSVTGNNIFTVVGDASSATKTYSVGFIPTIKDTNSENENLNTRNFVPYNSYKNELYQSLPDSQSYLFLQNIQGLKKGDFIQVDNEIMLVTRISGGTVYVKRGIFGTQAVAHSENSSLRTIQITPIELRRPSILRASGHTFEYVGFGPGNYSTGMPSNQTKILTQAQTQISQSFPNRGGLVVYSGMNSNGEFFIGRKKFNASTGDEIQPDGTQLIAGSKESTESTIFDDLTVNNLTVNNTLDATTASSKFKNISVSGISTFNADVNVNGTTTVKALNIDTSGAGRGNIRSSGGLDKDFYIANSSNSGTIKLSTRNDFGDQNNTLTAEYQKATITGELKVTGISTFNSTIKPNAIADKDGQVGLSSQVLTSTGSQLDWRNVNDLVSGRLMQFVRATQSTRVAHTSSWGTTNLSATITPSSTGSKILILVYQPVTCPTDASGSIRLLRGSTVLYDPGTSNFGVSTNDGDSWSSHVSTIHYIDSPSTTSSIAYSTEGIFARNGFSSNSGMSGRAYRDATSQIYLIEISG